MEKKYIGYKSSNTKMHIINTETCRLAMLGDICSEWEVLNAVWSGNATFDDSSRWGKMLSDLSELAPHSAMSNSKTIESLILWLMWMYYNEKSI